MNKLHQWELINKSGSDTLFTIDCIYNLCSLDSFPKALGKKTHIIYYKEFQEFDELNQIMKGYLRNEYDFSAFYKAQVVEISKHEDGHLIRKVYAVEGSDKTLSSEKIFYKNNVIRNIRYAIHCPE